MTSLLLGLVILNAEELIESLGSSLAPVSASLTRLEITAEARTPHLASSLETESDPSNLCAERNGTVN